MFDKTWINAKIAQFENEQIIIKENSFVAVKDKKIVQIDSMQNFEPSKSKKVIDVKNKLLTTALIDCHSHLVYGGNRANEFEQRLNGISYEDITAQGGGIASSIRATRAESEEEIYNNSAQRLKALIAEGVTTIEIKTGYGLNLETELKMLRIMDRLEQNHPIHIEKTFLGAHAVPPEYKNKADAYIDYIVNTMLPEVHKTGLVTAIDAYCEHLAFSLEQTKRVFEKAKSLGLRVKLHAEQFSQMGATKLACQYNALSCDHLEYIDEESIIVMSKSNTVAVLLPGAYYSLRETQSPPIDLFRKHKVAMAIATDLNPGTSPLASLLLMLNMAAVLFKMTVQEALLGVTKNAAKALSLEASKGSLAVGYDADFCIWNLKHPRDLVTSYLANALDYSVYAGEKVNV